MAEQRVLFLGDSLTASKYWKAIALPEAVVAGKGFPGQPIGSVMKQGAALLQAFKPTDVVLLAGVNNIVLGKPKTVIMQDLLVAWKQIHDVGAKVWAVTLTPWFGYRMFEDDEKFANKATNATRAVNDWIGSMRGQEGGPDYVIDTSALGDARGNLLHKYSHDKLHLNGKGYKKLAEIVGNALLGIAPAATTEAGEDKPEMPASVKYVINTYSDILKRRDLTPANVTWEKNEVTFWYWTPFRAETAKESVGSGTKYGAEMIYVYHRVIEAPKVAAGGAPVNLLQEAIEGYVDQLKAKDIAPAKVEYQDGTITFWFWTKFRADTAAETLPMSYKIAGKITKLRMAVLANTDAGQVPPVNQETPYTCGPAALRAVLRHYGKDVTEDTAADAVANVPILGARPHGMVRGAQELGFHAVASYFKDPQALRPFVSHDVPIIVIVDSFLKPGKQGHYVVVTEMTDHAVTIMDPHKDGNWRKLSLPEFDARWWHKRQNEHGDLEVARRLAIVLVPEIVETTEAGAEQASAPVTVSHGRTANLVFKGMPQWLNVMSKIQKVVTKAIVTAFGGNLAARGWDAAQAQLVSATKGLHGKELATWYNNATNEEVAALRMGQLREKVKDDRAKKNKLVALWDRLGLTNEALAEPSEAAMKVTLRADLLHYGMNPWVPLEMQRHGVQALAILLYGGPAVLPLLDAQLKAKPKVKSDVKDPGLTQLLQWAKTTMDALEEYEVESKTKITAVGGEFLPGVEGNVIALIERLSRVGLIPLKVSAAQLEEPAGIVDAVLFDFATQEHADRAADILPTTVQSETKKVRVKTRVVNLAQVANARKRTPTIRQKRFLDDARESENVGEVLKAYFLARKLGMDDAAEVLGQRHKALVEKTMPETSVGKKSEVETADLKVDWIFEVEQLKQVWPLVKANRVDIPGMKAAWRTADKLSKDSVFLFQADPETQAFVNEAADELRKRALAAIEGR